MDNSQANAPINPGEILLKHGLDLAAIVMGAVNPEAAKAEWVKAQNTLKSIASKLDAPSAEEALKQFRGSVAKRTSSFPDNEDNREASEVFNAIQTTILQSGILKSPRALSLLGEYLSGMNRQIDGHLIHQLSRLAGAIEDKPRTKKEIQDDYIALRNALIPFVPFAPTKVDLPAKTGNYDDQTPLQSCPIYNFNWTLDDGTYPVHYSGKFDWTDLAAYLSVPIFLPGKSVTVADFIEYLKTYFKLDIHSITQQQTFEYDGVTITLTRN